MKKLILEFTVFVCGALVMIYEIIGSRLLAPHIGTSTYVWTSLIGVILGALSLGYWLGGKYADRRPDIKILAAAIFLAGGLVALTILVQEIVLSLIAQSGLIIELKALLAAILLFAPASVMLGFVTPYAVKLKLSAIEDAGKTVGRLYALSTVGSILGTFLAGFFLIPFVGSTKTLYIIGASLIGLSLLLVPIALTQFKLGIIILFVAAISASEFQAYYLFKTIDLHDIDTEYSRVKVFTTKTNDGRPIRALATDPYFIQSGILLESDELAFDYAKYYHLIRHFKPDFEKTLMIGGAGYTFPRDYLKQYPSSKIDVVEIDPQMTEIAKQFFRLKEYPRLNIVHKDGRVFLNQADSNKYDAVLMDAFGSLFSVPFHLTTVEAVTEISRVLKDDGIVIFNLGGAIKGDSSKFLQAELNTYKKVFPQVLLFKVNSHYSDEQLQNLIIIAQKSSSNLPNTIPDDQTAKLLEHLYMAPVTASLPILTDDLAPVEYYNSLAQRNYRK